MFVRGLLSLLLLQHFAVESRLNNTKPRVETIAEVKNGTMFRDARINGQKKITGGKEVFSVQANATFANPFDSATLSDFVEIWNPYTVLRFWNSDTYRAANVSVNCGSDITKYMTALSMGERWALKMVDATGKHTWGLLSGNQFWLGAVDQCRAMESEYLGSRNGKGPASGKDVSPFPVGVTAVTLVLDILRTELSGSYKITIGLCLPSSCRTHDVEKLLYFAERQSRRNIPRNVTDLNVRNLSKGYSMWEDPTFYTLMVICAATFVIVLLGTAYDVFLRYHLACKAEEVQKKANVISEAKSFNLNGNMNDEVIISKVWVIEEHNEKHDMCNPNSMPKILSEVLLSFSLLFNISKIFSFDVGGDSLAVIHGLRFYSMLWIVLVHTCLMLNEISESKTYRSNAEADFLFQTISNGTYAVDTFFLISGCLVSFLYFRTIAKDDMKEVKITKGFCGKILQFLGMMWYRYFRLTPPYFLSILFARVISKWYYDHTILEKFAVDYRNCDNVMWRNLLYINTYFKSGDYCLVWSWYLANDTQFFTIGIIILIMGASVLPVAACATISLLIVSWITTAIFAFKTNHVPSIQEPFANYESLYDKPWSRIGPYLIGMMVGWYLCKSNCRLKMSKPLMLICWTLSAITMLSIVYGLYGNTFGPVLSIIYTTFSHSGWALSVAWILIACVCGHGGIINRILSWKHIFPLSRLSYCVYLTHPLIIRIIILHGESSMHLTHLLMATVFFGIAVVSYGISLFVSLFFEAPVVSVLKLVHPLRLWKKDSQLGIK